MNLLHSRPAVAPAIVLALLSGSVFASPFATVARAALDEKDPVVAALRADAANADISRMDVDVSRLTIDAATLELALPGKGTVSLVRDDSGYSGDGTLIWNGHVAGKAGPDEEALKNEVTLVKSGTEVMGSLRIGGQLYRMASAGKGSHVLTRIDERKMPADHGREYQDLPILDIGKDDAATGEATRAVSTIRVMVVITDRAKAKIGNTTNFVNLAVSETNTGYTNSGVEISLQLAGVYTTSYVESGSMSTDLARIRGTSDGYLDSVHSLRTSNAADVVMFVIDNPASCGLASGIGSTASTAFAAVHYSCATGYYSFGHEIGHLQSARHDPANDPTNTPYAYGHGYQYAAGGWRTIMAYACSTGTCNRINYWSNPAKLRSGVPMGTTTRHHNQRVLNNTKATIAGFR